MAEYIARDSAIEVVAGMERPNKYLTIQYLQEIKAADVEPVVHAHWEKPLDGRRKSSLCCSECKNLTYCSWDYCPSCGAHMDGEVEG